MTLTEEEMKYIAIGMQVEEARRKGGVTVLNKLGKKWFSQLGKLSAEKRKQNKLVRRTII